ncbi:MAG TPA: hypothetical protein VGF41_12860, partial [Myxococcaceae bacterium]
MAARSDEPLPAPRLWDGGRRARLRVGRRTNGSCASIPEETAGPFPGDGSNGPNALALSGIVRSDIRASLGASSASATGVPLTLALTLVNPVSSCAPVVGAAVYVWHCDALGRYSLYSFGSLARAGSAVSRRPIRRGGRWPHIHFEIYPSLASATSSG